MSGDPTVVLGLSCDYHDAAAALLVDGRVAAAVEEERFTRVKHDGSLPRHAIASCLAEAGLEAADVGHVVYYEKPFATASRFLATRQRQGPAGLAAFLRSTPDLVGRNVAIGARVASLLHRLGAPAPPPLQYVEHHRSHAGAAFLPSPFEHAAILTVDGLGEWATATIGRGAQHRTTLVEEQRFPHSIGLVYSLVTAWCGFSPNADEYKLMGLAPYGEPRFESALDELVVVGADGSVRVDGAAVRWFGPEALRRRRLHRLLGGPPRHPDDELTGREADLAASVQRLVERTVLAMADRAHRLTGETRLCLAGGVALNSVANGRLLREGPFDEVWIQPAAGDAGSALGAALVLWHDVLGNPRVVLPDGDAMAGAFLGPGASTAEAVAEVERLGIAHEVLGTDDNVAAAVAARLADGAVVGWYQGRMEFGPRALGHRSILADPRSPTVRARINREVKGRESFRPFAPAVLAEHAADWFELDHPSPYMLVVAPVRAPHRRSVTVEPTAMAERAEVPRSTIPACTHVDGSARIQTVAAEQNPVLHRLLTAFHERTGCPILLNTSFNRAGEPLVASIEGALRSARTGGLDLVALGRVLVDRADLEACTELDPGDR